MSIFAIRRVYRVSRKRLKFFNVFFLNDGLVVVFGIYKVFFFYRFRIGVGVTFSCL